jgi:hypothetical protein
MAGTGEEPPLVSLSEHPKAGRSIRRTKAWGGLLAFAVTGFASHATGMGLDGAALRALGGGILGYLLTWWLAMIVWRHLLQAEARVAIERAVARRKELAARALQAQAGNEQ